MTDISCYYNLYSLTLVRSLNLVDLFFSEKGDIDLSESQLLGAAAILAQTKLYDHTFKISIRNEIPSADEEIASLFAANVGKLHSLTNELIFFIRHCGLYSPLDYLGLLSEECSKREISFDPNLSSYYFFLEISAVGPSFMKFEPVTVSISAGILTICCEGKFVDSLDLCGHFSADFGEVYQCTKTLFEAVSNSSEGDNQIRAIKQRYFGTPENLSLNWTNIIEQARFH